MREVLALAQSSVARRLRQSLTGAQHGAGWPYYSGKGSRIEPTCWALLALSETWEEGLPSWQRFAAPHLEWLAATQGRDGLLLDQASGPPNFTANGLAACALAHLEAVRLQPDTTVNRPRLLDALVASKGISVDAPDPRQDNRLQGWPWMPDTFSWIEPTCWCLLALKKTGAGVRGASSRMQEAEKLIANRTCEPGGWNFGNASALGQDLRPYAPTTALGLIALQDRRQTPEVERSIKWLYQSRLKEPSAMALSLAAIGLRLCGLPVDDVEARLADDLDRAEKLGNVQALAMMLYALTAAQHETKAFRV